MNILYDYQIFVAQKFGGISRYFVDLMAGIENMPGFSTHLEVVGNKNYYLPERYFKEFSLIEKLKKYPRKEHKAFLKNQRTTLEMLDSGDIDVFHPTYYDSYFIDQFKKPLVITIHDMIYENFPSLFPSNEPTAHQKRLHIERADQIIAVSQRTKEDILKYYDVNDDKITVVHHGIDQYVPLSYEGIENLPKEYVLYVGSRSGYKNFDLLVQAFSGISKKYDGLKLVVAGSPLGIAEEELLWRNGIQDKVITFAASDGELNTLYKNAFFFVYPSTYEGFGLPILEAYKNECPVLLSNASCFPEIAGEAAAYFETFSLESLIEQMDLLIENSAYRNQLIQLGKEKIQEYPMESCIDRTAAVYKMLA